MTSMAHLVEAFFGSFDLLMVRQICLTLVHDIGRRALALEPVRHVCKHDMCIYRRHVCSKESYPLQRQYFCALRGRKTESY
jgi:hypothetical protein